MKASFGNTNPAFKPKNTPRKIHPQTAERAARDMLLDLSELRRRGHCRDTDLWGTAMCNALCVAAFVEQQL